MLVFLDIWRIAQKLSTLALISLLQIALFGLRYNVDAVPQHYVSIVDDPISSYLNGRTHRWWVPRLFAPPADWRPSAALRVRQLLAGRGTVANASTPPELRLNQ